MNDKKILHLFIADKFTKRLIPFLNENFKTQNQLYLGLLNNSDIKDYNLENCLFFKSPLRKNLFYNLKLFYSQCKKADKILLHGSLLIPFFLLFPFFLKKAYWIIMGTELYTMKDNSSFEIKMRKKVLSKIPYHITHIEGDSYLANQILHSKAKLIISPMYLSNTITTEDFDITPIEALDYVTVLVGNSFSENNNHIQLFDYLIKLNDTKIKVYVPLSYGYNEKYKNEIIKTGYALFGTNFFPITDFMEINDYKEFLKKIDIALFNHNRQEALGVTLTLLSLGKTVYVNPNTTSYESLIKKGFQLFDITLLNENGLRITMDVQGNKKLLENYYSIETLKKSYEFVYNN